MHILYHTIGSMNTRQKILDTAQRLIQTRSFHGFSFQDIADEVGIRKPSLYHHFASKDDVAIAVLDRAADWVRGEMNKVEGKEPTERLEAYFDIFRTIHGKGERMCPGGSFGAVFDAVASPVQRRLHSFSQMHLQWLEKVVREGVEGGQFRIGDQRPRDVAMQILAGVQGALLMGRLTGDPQVIDTVAVELKSYLRGAPDLAMNEGHRVGGHSRQKAQ
jgi:TetR/AcrR family transcriptional regulator, transcriptional repressor for nem operon